MIRQPQPAGHDRSHAPPLRTPRSRRHGPPVVGRGDGMRRRVGHTDGVIRPWLRQHPMVGTLAIASMMFVVGLRIFGVARAGLAGAAYGALVSYLFWRPRGFGRRIEDRAATDRRWSTVGSPWLDAACLCMGLRYHCSDLRPPCTSVLAPPDPSVPNVSIGHHRERHRPGVQGHRSGEAQAHC